MAGGKLSPRQKMINLMYLVFIAMLAMNMSKEVLQAFGLMDEKLVSANAAATKRNNLSYEDLKLKEELCRQIFGACYNYKRKNVCCKTLF